MVFCFNSWSVGGDEQENQSGDDKYFTAPSRLDSGQQGSASTSRNVDYMTSGVRNPNGISTTLRRFKLDELSEATENFDESTKIGAGGFGSVHLGIIKRSEHPYDDIQVQRQWQTEVDFLGQIEHPNLVKLIGCCSEEHGNESHWLLVYEYMPNRSLDYHLSGRSNTPLPWNTRLKIAQDAAIGLKYLHEGKGPGGQFIFRDFKPSNVLLDKDWNAKLSDCGFVREGPHDGRSHVSTLAVGTKGYAAPEYVQTGRLTFKSDVWSYGIFLVQLMTGRPPPAQKNSEIKHECMRWVCCCAGAGNSQRIIDPRLEGTYSKRSMDKISSVADKCLVKDHKSRPTMSEVLEMVNEAIALQHSP
ncbi:hypothetical protein M8C21_023452 [Ambrosia artemisiifolia]|uniref:Protein kinase domain-containing protein n=1 Tax=Ambrosia artemisiifolia TaxID=4212 RepID=A0AAD5D3V9_AMBAR|nr:hypothetical protein M8C21_023452 [Ambrosia artemisiifolia]